MLNASADHPLVLGLFAAQIAALVIHGHQGLSNAILYRSTRRRELLRYAIWCGWSALLPLTQIRVGAAERGGRVLARVSDGGQRPEGAVAASMFHAPFTTKGVGRGTGLGLALCQRIVDALGGSIELDQHEPTKSIVIELPSIVIEGDAR